MDQARQFKLFSKLLRETKKQSEQIDFTFIRWYLQVRIEADENAFIGTDGPGDGGIDAILYPPDNKNKVIICQSYYTTRFGSAIPSAKLQQFCDLIDIFYDDDEFSKWLLTVRQELRTEYRKLRRCITSEEKELQWIFLSNARKTDPVRTIERKNHRYYDLLIVDTNEILRAYALFLEGASPPEKPLKFNFNGTPLQSIRNRDRLVTYFFAAKLDDIVKYTRGDETRRLFSRNVRLQLRKSPINAEIVNTYVNQPEEFLDSHNGLTMICSRASIHAGEVELQQPNVVNGAQTLLSLAESEKTSKGKAYVIVRVIEVNDYVENKQIVRNIVLRSNRQNAIKPEDMIACDERQVQIERFFRLNNRIYERRRGQVNLSIRGSGRKITSIQLARVLASCHPNIGIWMAANKRNELFSGKVYQQIFDTISLQEILAKYLLHELLESGRRCSILENRSALRYSWRNVLLASWISINSDRRLKRAIIKEQLLSYIDFKTADRRTRSLKTCMRNMYEYAEKEYLKAQRHDIELTRRSFFFGSQERADMVVTSIAKRYRSDLLKKLNAFV